MISFYLSIVETEEQKNKVIFIYENFFSYMSFKANQVLKNKDDVEDVVHESMLKIIENIDIIDLSDVSRARSLCGMIAKNKAIDHCKLKDNQSISLEETITEAPLEDSSPEEIVIKEEMYNILLSAFHSLDDRYRDPCILKFLYNYKEREIALLLDLPPNTVSTRIYRGKQILREALRKENFHV